MENSCIIHSMEAQELDFTKAVRELDSLIGLSAVKKEIHRIINLAKVDRLRKQHGLRTTPMSFHMVFTGNPGTGKTTVARILGKIFKGLGILSKGHLVEVDRSDLCANYVGQTATKTKKVIQSALGGVLFIDEAYSLNVAGGSGAQDYGKEAVSILLKAMEDYREDIIIIVAGYPDLMREFLKMNPGLESRFRFKIAFEDYTAEEMTLIFWFFCTTNGFLITKHGLEEIKHRYASLCKKRIPSFSNARMVRNNFEETVINQAQRVVVMPHPTDQDLISLRLEDICNAR